MIASAGVIVRIKPDLPVLAQRRFAIALCSRMAMVGIATMVALSANAQGSFSPLVKLRNSNIAQNGLGPVHGTLMPDGSVMFIGVQREDGTRVAPIIGPKFVSRYDVVPSGTQPWPASQSMTPDVLPYDCGASCVFAGIGGTWSVDDTIMCSGHTLLQDGSFFSLGGTRFWKFEPDDPGVAPYSVAFGLDHNFHYNPTTAVWTRLAGQLLAPGESNFHGRWYGTATRLADGRVLTTGGYDIVGAVLNDTVVIGTQTHNVSVEVFDPAKPGNPRQLLSAAENTPANIFNVDYSHDFQFPFALSGGQDVLMIGMAGEPIFMTPSTTPNWLSTGQIRPGEGEGHHPMHGSSTIMLPLRLTPNEWGYGLGAIMTIGGGGPNRQSHADVYDAVGGGWKAQRVNIGAARHHPSSVLLPDGRIFVIGGHNTDNSAPYPLDGVLLAPSATGYSVTASAAMAGSRGYHTVALLLPDGRVLVAGGRVGGATGDSDEQPTAEYYSPDYMFGPRPSITTAPTNIYYDTPFAVAFSGSTAPSEMVLMALGSMTHSFDANQRSVELYHVQVSANTLAGYLAGGERFAPPGHYMLFVLDENRRPSKGVIVKISRS